MRGPGCAALLGMLAACGPPPVREQHTVYAPPAAAAPAPDAPDPGVPPTAPAALVATVPVASDPERAAAPPPGTFEDVALRRTWLSPLRRRDVAALADHFVDDCRLELMRAWRDAAPHETRRGRRALSAWFRGHVLAWPYADVRPVYLGSSAREGTEIAVVELVDGCGVGFVRLTAKLRPAGGPYTVARVRLEQLGYPGCPGGP